MFVGDCHMRSAYFGDTATDGRGNLEREVRIIDPDDGDAVRNLIRAPGGHLDAGTGGGTYRSAES